MLRKIGKILFTAFLFIYIVVPFDLIPEAIFGPVGLLDDAVAGLLLWQELKGKGVSEWLKKVKL